MRTKIVAGNWKMNKNRTETESLLSELSAKLPDTEAQVIVAPTFCKPGNCQSRFGRFHHWSICPKHAFRGKWSLHRRDFC